MTTVTMHIDAPADEVQAMIDGVMSESPIETITQARVAAAFEAWVRETYRIPKVADHNPAWVKGGEEEGDYAKRLAAGLFKYLEGV